MRNAWKQVAPRHSVASQLVRHDHPRHITQVPQQAPEEALGSFAIAAFLNEDVEHDTILIHSAPKIMLHALDPDEHLVHVPRPGDKWHMDEVFIRIQGMQHYLWRAVDQDGVVLDILVQERRDGKAAKRFFRRLLRHLSYVPRVIVTDKLRSYAVARRHLLPGVAHRQSRYLNNRAENSHRPTRRRERQMQRFKSPGQAQDFLSAHGMIYGHFRPRRHLMTAGCYRRQRAKVFRVWRQETWFH